MANSSNFRDLQSANKGKTYFLLASMGLLTWLVAYAALTYFGAGTTSFIVPIAVGIALVGVWVSYYGSDKLVITMTGAKVITREDAPELFNLIEEVVIASGLPMPKVAIVEDSAPNAFATGRDPEHALIAFTTRILEVMDRDELQGVIAHEMSHVANRDTLVSAVAATTAGAIAILSDVANDTIGSRCRSRTGIAKPSGSARPANSSNVAKLTLSRASASVSAIADSSRLPA